MKYDVFISYSRKDTAIADQICAAFNKAGITYFIDRQGIGGGMEFPKVLAPAIRESEIFLLLASQNAYESAFTDREITFAFNKKRGEKMLPYIIDDTPFPEHLELIFSTNNWLILKLHPIEPKLIEDVLRLLGRTKPTIKKDYETKQTKTSITASQIHDEFDLISSQEENGKWGFIDEQGNVAIPFEYDFASPLFSEGLVAVEKDSKWGFIDKHGNIIIPIKYDAASRFSEELAAVKKDSKWGFIDKHGNVIIPIKYDSAGEFSEGFAAVKKDGKWGFIDKHGNVIIPIKHDSAGEFSEGLVAVEKDSKWGFIDKHGNIVIPFEYESRWEDVFPPVFSDGIAVVEKNGKSGCLDLQGITIIPFEYDFIERFSKTISGYAVAVKNNKYGLIDKKGNTIIPFKYLNEKSLLEYIKSILETLVG